MSPNDEAYWLGFTAGRNASPEERKGTRTDWALGTAYEQGWRDATRGRSISSDFMSWYCGG